jgi:hypothetical protein
MSHQAYRPEEVMTHPSPAPDTQLGEPGEDTHDPQTERLTQEESRRAAAVTHPLGPRARRMALSLSEL